MATKSRRKEMDAQDAQIGQKREAMVAFTGPAEITKDDIQIVPGPRLGDKAEVEKFMHEYVTVRVHPGERFAEDPVPLGVNGRMSYVFRNQDTLMPRYLVYQLAKAKTDVITQDPGNPDPAVANKLNISPSLKYPFSVIQDPSGDKGHEWLRTVLAEA
jgi:hypothetical protein